MKHKNMWIVEMNRWKEWIDRVDRRARQLKCIDIIGRRNGQKEWILKIIKRRNGQTEEWKDNKH